MKAVESPRTPVRGAEVWPLSVAAYHVLGEASLIPKNTELLYGLIYQKMPKSPFHSFLVQFVQDALLRVLPTGFVVRTEQPITCVDSEPEPDVSVAKGTKEDFRHEHPHTAELVIEVCVTSHEYDRAKLRAYANAGVKECWLILGPEKQIEVHRQPAGDRFATRAVHGPGGRIASAALPDVAIDLDALFTK